MKSWGEERMNAVRNIYEKMPDTITVPHNLRQKRAEVIILPLEDETSINSAAGVKRYYGSLPNFPERESQGEFEIRDRL